MRASVRTAIALGSNSGDRLVLLRAATLMLRRLAGPGVDFRASPIYETAPVDCPPGSPPFLNAVVSFSYAGASEVLMEKLAGFESALGRPGSRLRNAPRTIDLDLLCFGGQAVHTGTLTLPHPRMTSRRFVLAPLGDIEPDMRPLADGPTAAALLSALPKDDFMRPIPAVLDDESAGRRAMADFLKNRKAAGPAVTALTAYDYPVARMLDESGIDVVLVGDSLGMVVLGHPDTTRVTLDDMRHHLRAVRAGVSRALVVADLPIHTCDTPEAAVSNARMLIADGADAVKLEGGVSVAPQIAALVAEGIPVMGHIGMLPQHVLEEGGYRKKGVTPEAEALLLADGRAVADAGAFSVVLEIVEAAAAARITKEIPIPTIGIGSGAGCDGQILVTHDLVGLFPWFTPRFVRPEADLAGDFRRAVEAYIRRTQTGG